ncbi:MAG: hypothetical protein ACI8RZ_000637 [Myxococcota bacterium]|jgi:hypothetical protein
MGRPKYRETGRGFLAALAAMAAALGLTAALLWPMPMHPVDHMVAGFFHGGHVWCFSHMADMIAGEAGWQTDHIGWPHPVQLRFIAWAPAYLVAPLQDLLGPIGAYNIALLLSFPLAALAGMWLIRLTGVRPASAAAGGLVFAFSPVVLGFLAAGQTAKIQHWTLAVALVALVGAIRRWRWLPLVPMTGLLVGFTSPTFAMFLPLAAGLWTVWTVWTARRWLLPGLRAVLALGLLAGALLWIRPHYDYSPGRGQRYAFAPSTAPPGTHADLLPQVARIDTMLVGSDVPRSASGAGNQSVQVAYMGWPMLAAGGALSVTRFAGRGLGWGTLLTSAVLSLGPRLADADGFIQRADGTELLLPGLLLAEGGYPIARSGMYYRFLVLAGLGGGLLIAAGSGRRWWLAWLLAAGVIGDGLHETAELWPRPSAPIPGRSTLEAMSQDDRPGAVLAFPLKVSDHGGGEQILLATLHDRPTNGLPRDMQRQQSTLDALDWMAQAAASEDGAAVLSEKGVRYVIWMSWLRPRRDDLSLSEVEAVLGPPQQDGALLWWVL